MKLSNNEFRDLTRNFLTEGLTGNEQHLQEQGIPSGQPDGGSQSFTDFTQRMEEVTGMLESLYIDYARHFPREGWFMDSGEKELASELVGLYNKANNLLSAAKSIEVMDAAEKTGEI